MKVLIVDDIPTNLRLLRAILEAERMVVVEAVDGIAALGVLQQEDVDVVISDILMPRMDGYRLCQEVRHHPRLQDLPFIFYTATYTSPADEKLCMDMGADKYLRKPASARDLLAALVSVTSAPRPAPVRTPRELDVVKEYSERLVDKLEQKNVELTQRTEELHTAQQRLTHILSHTPAVIYTLNLGGPNPTPVIVSGNIESVTGFNVVEASNYNWWLGSLHPEERERVIATITEGFAKDGCSLEYRLRHKNGNFRWIEDHNRVLRDDHGVPKQAVGIWTDITDKKDLEEKFLRSQRLENIGALAGGIAHDLNNALAPILMATECMAMSCQPGQQAMLDIITESAKRSADMVKQVLTFARGTQGKHGAVQPAHLVKEMAEIARHTFPKAIEIQANITSKIWVVQANPTELHQILLNLSVNARDAMPEGGSITLGASNVQISEDHPAISPEAKPGPYVRLTVADTGSGMTDEVRARIFDPFFTTKPVGKGTGLGLSTVRKIVKDHGGFLTLKSQVGQGTEFGVYLPAEPEGLAPAAEQAHLAPPVGHGQVILLVDDEATVRNMAAQTLQSYGYKVIPAIDGARGVALCVQYLGDLHLVITDLNMPSIDGLTMVRAVRTFAPHMKFIVTSGSHSHYDSEAMKELAVNRFLRKPYSAGDLLRAVDDVLHETKPTGQAPTI